MFKKTINPELFRKMREKAGLTREEMASIMGWSVGTVVNYETKELKISLHDFDKFLMATTNTPEDRQTVRNLIKSIEDTLQQLSASPAKS